MNSTANTKLLVSVRSTAEAMVALEGGAALIDVKEPLRGSLGRADADVIRDVTRVVRKSRPVSAALGEWADDTSEIPDADLAYVKWGLAGCARRSNWRQQLTERLTMQQRPQLVLVAYADWQCALAPSVEDVFALAQDHPGSVLLLDTHCKDATNILKKTRPTLLDWMPVEWVEELCARCRKAQVKIALAGSLGISEIRLLRGAQPDWFAVRGAVCDAGDRQSSVQIEKVRELVEMLRPTP